MAQVHLSNPGNSRHQLGRMLAVDARQVTFDTRIGKKSFQFFLAGCSLGYASYVHGCELIFILVILPFLFSLIFPKLDSRLYFIPPFPFYSTAFRWTALCKLFLVIGKGMLSHSFANKKGHQ